MLHDVTWCHTSVTYYTSQLYNHIHITEEHRKFQKNDVILYVNSIEYMCPLE